MRISEQDQQFLDQLVFNKCYSFKESPVIVTSGESITPFFLNGENVIGDEAKYYKDHEMNPMSMYNWVIDQLEKSSEFKKAMSIITKGMMPELKGADFISGGRTRDWPFSAALAYMFGKPALFLYKPEDGSNPLVISPEGRDIYSPKSLFGTNIFHIVDLVTTASSVANNGGWIDQIRNLEGNIETVYSVIDRNQGADLALREKEVILESGVQINRESLSQYDPGHKEIVLEYLTSPECWSMWYLEKNGINCLIPQLKPAYSDSRKDNRILKFVCHNYVDLEKRGLLGKIIDASDRFTTKKDEKRGVEEGLSFKEGLAFYQ